jgi:hypothetical protein
MKYDASQWDADLRAYKNAYKLPDVTVAQNMASKDDMGLGNLAGSLMGESAAVNPTTLNLAKTNLKSGMGKLGLY